MSQNDQLFDRYDALTFDDVVVIPGYSETLPDAVDTTGAGDAFAAAFLLRWRAGAPVADALAFAADISARAVGRVGGRP